jgi:hypothetical protein
MNVTIVFSRCFVKQSRVPATRIPGGAAKPNREQEKAGTENLFRLLRWKIDG